MSEEPQEGVFKPLKLTWLKSAPGVEATPATPSVAPDAVQASPTTVSSSSSVTTSGVSQSPPGLTLLSFKKGALADIGVVGAEVPPAFPEVEPARVKSSFASPVKLSPSAASTGPVLKPLGFGNKPPVAEGSSSPVEPPVASRTISTGVSFVKATDGGLSGVPPELPKRYLGESSSTAKSLQLAKSIDGMRVGVLPDDVAGPAPMVALAPPFKKTAATPGRGSPPPVLKAAPSRRLPLRTLVLAGSAMLVLAAAAYWVYGDMLPGDEASEVPVVAAARPVAKAAPVVVRDESVPVRAAEVVRPATGDVVADAGADEIPGVASGRDVEIEQWLESASVTYVSDKRMTLDGRVYSLGSVVFSVGSLRWIGRDTQTRDLLFMDDNKVIYTKSTLMRPMP